MSFLWCCLKLVKKKMQVKCISAVPRIWTWLLFIHYLCICIPWQLVPRASLNLRDLYSHMERWKDNSVRICYINISTATGWEFFVWLYIIFFLIDSNRQTVGHLYLCILDIVAFLCINQVLQTFLTRFLKRHWWLLWEWCSPSRGGYSTIVYHY